MSEVYRCIRCGGKYPEMPWEEHIKVCPTYKKLEERCALFKDREQAIEELCNYANAHCLPVSEVWPYETICRVMGLTPDDFYDDSSSLTEYERNVIGLSYWIPASKRKVV
jgi:hypothetical protein